MTNPFRMALKVWLCLTWATFWGTGISLIAHPPWTPDRIMGITFISFVAAGGGFIFFWEKLTG